MSTTVLHIIELVKSLPLAEQRAIRQALASPGGSPGKPTRRRLQRLPDGSYINPDGIPNDHSFFKILEEDEAARRLDLGPPPPEFD